MADGNYPFSTGSPVMAEKVFLNLMPGMVKVTDVLEALVGTIPIEAAAVMVPDDGAEQPIFAEFRRILPEDVEADEARPVPVLRRARSTNTALVIATGEQRVYANLLLTIGVVPPEA